LPCSAPFGAVYLQRKAPDSRHVWAYFGNLGGHSTAIEFSDAEANADQRHQALIRLVALWRERLQATAEPWQYPGNIGRCFLLVVRDEDVPSAKLDQIPAPYWPALWGLAARGHAAASRRRPPKRVATSVCRLSRTASISWCRSPYPRAAPA
jgi:hypothetical protein